MVVNIKYDDGDASSYEAVELSMMPNGEDVLFDRGNFIVDWYEMNRYVAHMEEDYGICSFSSSVDHFIMDSELYTPMFLAEVNGEWDLYDQNSVDIEQAFEFFIPRGEKWNWKELTKHIKESKAR